jgi:PTS system nitrogen regulatory IIA component
MKVVDFLREDWMVADLRASDKEGVLRELAQVLARSGTISDVDRAVFVLLEREKLGSTGIGEGIAIPHGKLPELSEVVAVFGRSRQGVDFDSMDGEPSHLFFLLMAPENSASLHLKALARISRLLKAKQFREELLGCASGDELYRKISEEDAKY